jgi:diadenosine tetraphosphate (Ap4A) HIT family hydrolase
MHECPLCQASSKAQREGRLLARLEWCDVLLAETQGSPGWCVLVLREHVEHLDALAIGVQAAIFAEVALVARAIRAAFPESGVGGGPPRINYECLGNQVPHVHWHVIPRHAGDPGPRDVVWVWPAPQRTGAMPEAERHDLARRLRLAMTEAMSREGRAWAQ